jgi:potassium channel subfamily K
MASFAVTAIQRIVTELSEWRLAKRKVHEGIKNAGAEDSHDVVSHSEYVERHHERWTSRQQHRRHDDAEARTEEKIYTEALVGHALELERHARRLLMTHLPNGSKAQIVLKADWVVQLRDLKTLERQGSNSDPRPNNDSQASEFHAGGDDGPDWINHPLDDDGTVEEIRRYREAFAAFLATGSRLRKLEGAEKYKAERRLMMGEDETVNSPELGEGRSDL